jgi:23S rRNA pseudouridine2605 synthase
MGSRRACEQLIDEGRVSVDGKIVREQGLRVDPARVSIEVDNLPLPAAKGHIVMALNKPKGVVSTMSDPEGRRCVGDLVAGREERLFHVGRLDADTEGLLLLTNDGDLAQHLAHPSHGVAKTYIAQVRGRVARDVGRRLKEGVELEDGLAKADSFRLLQSTPDQALVELVLHEGRKHIVRRMLEEVELPVVGLVRTKIGPINLGDLKPGRTRILSNREVGELLTESGR